MVALSKFNLFTQDLCQGKHIFSTGGQTFAAALASAAVATNHLYGDITEVAAGGGYTTGGNASAMSDSSTTGTETVTAANPATWTGSGAGMGPFRYVVFYNVTQATPLKPLVAFYDYGSAISLNAGDTFAVAFSSGLFTVA